MLTLNVGVLAGNIMPPRREHNDNFSSFDHRVPIQAPAIVWVQSPSWVRAGPRLQLARASPIHTGKLRSPFRLRLPGDSAHRAPRRLRIVLRCRQCHTRVAWLAELHLWFQRCSLVTQARYRRDAGVQLGYRISQQLAAPSIHRSDGAERKQCQHDRPRDARQPYFQNFQFSIQQEL